jgi:O-acetyl-ADP-ribose deacetylase (regulator of RNase III)
MSKINYVVGDATQPQGKGNKIICHVCNDIGVWGGGFVLAVSKRWGFPEHFYRARQKYPLGHVDVLSVDADEDGKNIVFVANMIGQHLIQWSNGVPPIRYEALREALTKVNARAIGDDASLHMPRIGSDRAGGKWELIEAIIEECTTVPVTVYDLP